jgi:hypothetical protein
MNLKDANAKLIETYMTMLPYIAKIMEGVPPLLRQPEGKLFS